MLDPREAFFYAHNSEHGRVMWVGGAVPGLYRLYWEFLYKRAGEAGRFGSCGRQPCSELCARKNFPLGSTIIGAWRIHIERDFPVWD